MLWQLNLKIWLPFLALFLAKTHTKSYSYQMAKSVLQQLNGNVSQFNAWTKELSEQLSLEQQQHLAWNVQFLDENLKSDLRQMQRQLNPDNSLKVYLWMSYYWQLRRSNRLESDSRLLPQFAIKLRQLRLRQHWNLYLQNMMQSFPSYLRDLIKSRWLCLKHNRDQLYVLPHGVLELGANSNCSMWQVAESFQYWLRLQNACELNATWFINMLQVKYSNTFMLVNAASNNSNIYCIRNGESYFLTKNQVEAGLEIDCLWQINDCTHLTTIWKQ